MSERVRACECWVHVVPRMCSCPGDACHFEPSTDLHLSPSSPCKLVIHTHTPLPPCPPPRSPARAQEILRYSTTDVLAPQWAAMEAGVRRAADADEVRPPGCLMPVSWPVRVASVVPGGTGG